MLALDSEGIWTLTFVFGRFLITFWILCLWLVCSYHLFFPGSILEGYSFLRICPFLRGCPFYGILLLIVVSYDPCISALSVVTSLSFLILLIWVPPLSLFLISMAKGLSILFYLLKEPAFTFIDLCYCLLHFFFIYFCSDFYDFFPSAKFNLFYSLPVT